MSGRLTALLLPLTLFLSSAGAQEPIDIGGRWEPLVDNYLIDWTKGQIELRLHSPTMQDVVIVYDRPWEGNTCGYHTIFRDGELCRMYYRGWNHDSKTQKQVHPAVVCYAESTDGINWKKPDLNLIEFAGSRSNNIIIADFGTHNFTPFKDTNPACPPDARYKAVARGEDEGHKQLFAFQSPDGIRWKPMQKGPIITEGAFDSQNLTFWDSLRGEYRCYFRDFRKGFRDIKTATSGDFIHWTKPVWLDYGDAPAEHLYTNQIQPYYRAPHIFIGLPTRYIPQRGSLTEGLLMTSRDASTAGAKPSFDPDATKTNGKTAATTSGSEWSRRLQASPARAKSCRSTATKATTKAGAQGRDDTPTASTDLSRWPPRWPEARP